jgi:hypothetical protein
MEEAVAESSWKVVNHEMMNNNIRNFSFEDFFTIFKTSTLDVSTIWLINSGFDENGGRRFTHLILRGCQIRPFFGPHLVSVLVYNAENNKTEEMKTFWVHSLTHLRRSLFHYKDRLSFERSTYLRPYEDANTLIRIKSVRAFLTLPVLEWTEKAIPKSIGQKRNNEMLAENEKTEHLLNSSIQNMITFLSRETQNTPLQCIAFIKKYTGHYLDSLMEQLEKEK